ncbi:hypothetical protein PF005_g23509 [Phytophthora fragariae]|uniref:Reverse transcriptase Ty1/copia-type domain-containing protein n=1 Tax=Phytophthora fragariae TaxID=53985 RepID=A0A6A3F854_9STRA|nr:hypothetical protein PF009_g11800 [Phytophthora fragariae]KAE8996647.1 hypothetical protein PF011_g15815 [Phytophthora fragariae]KAE9083265.1 hypothetical protein PF010_g21283 [Phytophthora fragariae]KAE9113210.1 hypothetical protein PF006_g19804 [Phytophthora fragariae]KAE9128142.1 hypothetical protein PF007_g5374 [Phytophthora fragariae]
MKATHGMATRHGGSKTPPREIVGAVYREGPKCWYEAIMSDDSIKWRTAAESELASLEDNKTWELMARTGEVRPLHTKWVFKTKTDANGNVERYKARLIACGNEQVHGVNYTMTFSAVMDTTSTKVILVLSLLWGVPARHGDVSNAYVKAETEPDMDIHLRAPQGMAVNEDKMREHGVKEKSQLVLWLRRSLYGLKQAGHLWTMTLHDELIKGGFVQCATDTCMNFKADKSGMTVVGVYVDELLVTGTSKGRVDELFSMLITLQIKDLGVVSKFLGMRHKHTPEGEYTRDQEATVDELLEKFGLQDAHSVTVPIGPENENEIPGGDMPLPKESSAGSASIKSFQSIVGWLL